MWKRLGEGWRPIQATTVAPTIRRRGSADADVTGGDELTLDLVVFGDGGFKAVELGRHTSGDAVPAGQLYGCFPVHARRFGAAEQARSTEPVRSTLRPVGSVSVKPEDQQYDRGRRARPEHRAASSHLSEISESAACANAIGHSVAAAAIPIAAMSAPNIPAPRHARHSTGRACKRFNGFAPPAFPM